MKDILVLGATSAIAQAFCRSLATAEARFWLLGRDGDKLRIVADDLAARGVKEVQVRTVHASDFSGMKAAMLEGFKSYGQFDVFLAAQGSLPDQEKLEADPQLLNDFFQVNLIMITQATLLAAAEFERGGRGACVVIGSVAGDRGRRGNYVYGAAKSALETFCEGLRQRLEPGVQVLLVKPGPTDTPMTGHLKKTALFTTPEKVAARINAGLKAKTAVIYAPFYWRWIMPIIKLAPRSVVKRLRA